VSFGGLSRQAEIEAVVAAAMDTNIVDSFVCGIDMNI
jgi:hypothetical protein